MTGRLFTQIMVFLLLWGLQSSLSAAEDTTADISEEELELIGDDLLISDEPDESADTADPADSAAEQVSADSAASADSSQQKMRRGGPAGTGAVGGPVRRTQRRRSDDSATAADTAAADSAERRAPRGILAEDTGAMDESSISFSENIQEYRSPQKALLLSLAVPGLGQAYTRRYWKVPVFVAAEAALITGAVVYRNKQKDKVAEAEDLVDGHFSLDRAEVFYDSLGEFAASVVPDSVSGHDSTLYRYVFGGASIYSSWNDLSGEVSGDVYSVDNGAGSYVVTQGWDDATVYGRQDGSFYDDAPQTEEPLVYSSENPFGISLLQQDFRDKMARSRDFKGRSRTMILGVVLNHVVSAADAFLTARRYNRKLLSVERDEPFEPRPVDRMTLNSTLYRDGWYGLTTEARLTWRF
ncbi:MAG: DUF5683 domain-containing protein [Fibrobacterota bacterium]